MVVVEDDLEYEVSPAGLPIKKVGKESFRYRHVGDWSKTRLILVRLIKQQQVSGISRDIWLSLADSFVGSSTVHSIEAE